MSGGRAQGDGGRTVQLVLTLVGVALFISAAAIVLTSGGGLSLFSDDGDDAEFETPTVTPTPDEGTPAENEDTPTQTPADTPTTTPEPETETPPPDDEDTPTPEPDTPGDETETPNETETPTETETESDGEVDGRIVGYAQESNSYTYGDTVEAEVTVRNTGETEHTFYIGFTVVGPNGDRYDNDGQTHESVTLEPGETGTVTVQWDVEDDAEPGQYDVETALWAEEDDGDLNDELDRVSIPDAFELEEEDN